MQDRTSMLVSLSVIAMSSQSMRMFMFLTVGPADVYGPNQHAHGRCVRSLLLRNFGSTVLKYAVDVVTVNDQFTYKVCIGLPINHSQR